MALYNKEQYAERAIKSILGQSHQNLKLVIIDDCSTDKSLPIAEKFLSDSRVRIIKNEFNAGCYYSKNVGLSVMESENFDFYTIHDADDYSDPDRFEKMIKEIKLLDALGMESIEERIGDPLPFFYGERKKVVFAHALFKRKAFDLLGYYDNAKNSADFEYWYRLKRFGDLNKINSTSSFNNAMYFAECTENSMLLTHDYEERIKYCSDIMINIEESMVPINNFYRPFFEIKKSICIKK